MTYSKDNPKVLVISHNVFSGTGNMGRTMKDFLSCVPPQNLAQLYFHSERPTVQCCQNYFRITDTDVLKSVFSRKAAGTVFTEEDIAENQNSRTDKGLKAKVYQFSRRRTPLIYLARNLMWSAGVWQNKKLEQWIQDFSPDLIFFASGDYSFAYKVVCRIAQKYELPVLTWCCDDFYISRTERQSFWYRLNKKNLMKWARAVMEKTDTIITISDKMAKDYQKLFHKRTVTLRISADMNTYSLPPEKRSGIAYIGNLGVNRSIPLVNFAGALAQLDNQDLDHIDVYSNESNPEILKRIRSVQEIHFKGALSGTQIAQKLGVYRYLLHIEAFDQSARNRTRYSLSTKIGESLRSGACLIAYGPAELASMEYLKEHSAAFVTESADIAVCFIKESQYNQTQYRKYIENAEALASECHDKAKNESVMLELLRQCRRKGDELR